MPNDWNDKAAVEKFYTDLGRPKEATAYTFPERPDKQAYSDTDKAFMDQMRQPLFEAGLTQRQVDGVVAAYNGAMGKLEGVFKAFAADSAAALDKEWGDKKPAMLEAASRFAQRAFGENLENMRRLPIAGGGFLLDHPQVVKAFALAGQAMAEDGWGGGGGGQGDPFATPEAAQKYVDGLYDEAAKDPKHWMNHPESAEYKRGREHLNRVQRFIHSRKGAQQ